MAEEPVVEAAEESEEAAFSPERKAAPFERIEALAKPRDLGFLRVLGKRYVVETAEPGPFDEDTFGVCFRERCWISLREGMDVDVYREVLLHEVLHALEHILDLDVKEATIVGLASGLLAVLRDNPKFAAWLVEEAA